MSVHEYQKSLAQCRGITLALIEAGFSSKHAVFDEQTGLSAGTVQIEFFTDLTTEQSDALDAFMAAYDGDIAFARNGRRQGIDRVTSSIFNRGFTYDGVRFSLSVEAQANWNRMAAKHAAGNLTFPVDISTKTGGSYTIADATAYEAFESACMTAIETILDTGRSLRAQVNSASTVEEINAIVDDREF